MWGRVAVACVPSAVLGLLLDDWLEANFGSPLTVAAMLILYGIAFIVVEKRNAKTSPAVTRELIIAVKMSFVLCFKNIAPI